VLSVGLSFLAEMSKTPREIVVSNDHLLVALDNKMRIRDFFYPYVARANQKRRNMVSSKLQQRERLLKTDSPIKSIKTCFLL
jgi:GH15 family glucan-1,4-alpha-glucosidase